MSEFIGTLYETVSLSRVKFSTKPGGSVRVGTLVQIGEGKDKQLGRVIYGERKNYLIDQDGAVQLSSLFEEHKSMDAQTIGIRGEFRDYIVGEIEIIGRRKKNSFKRPDTPLKIGEKIFKAEKNFIDQQIKPEGKTVSIGSFRIDKNVNVYLDINELITKHFCVLAMTGAGKSWAISVLIEELALNYDIPIVIFDPHGEYSSLSSLENPKGESIIKKVKIYVTADDIMKKNLDELFFEKFSVKRISHRLCVNIADLETYQIINVLTHLHDLAEAQKRILQAGWSNIRKKPSLLSTTNLDDIIKELSTVAQEVTRGTASAHILKAKMELFFNKAPFIRKSPTDPKIDINEIVKKGQITVIDMSGMELIYQQVLIAIIANKILQGRMNREIPPVLTIFEEAHRFIPSGAGLNASKPTLKKIAQEGRKFLMGLGIISQRPSRVDSDVLSQCNTQIILRLTNPNDQTYVKNISEHVTAPDLEEIKALSPGEAYIFGSAVPLSLPIKISEKRYTKHGGYTPEIISELDKYKEI